MPPLQLSGQTEELAGPQLASHQGEVGTAVGEGLFRRILESFADPLGGNSYLQSDFCKGKVVSLLQLMTNNDGNSKPELIALVPVSQADRANPVGVS